MKTEQLLRLTLQCWIVRVLTEVKEKKKHNKWGKQNKNTFVCYGSSIRISTMPVQCHNYNENMSNVKQWYRYLAMSLPHQRTCSLILHGPGPAVVSVFINNSLQAVSGVKHVLLAPWEMTLLALSLGRLLGEYIWTALQSIIEGRPTQIPVQPATPEEPASMGRLRSIHSFCEFNISFILDMDWTAKNETAEL